MAKWMTPYFETPWVKLLSLVAPDFPAPPDASQSWHSGEWLMFEFKCALAPLVVFLIGCGVACTLACSKRHRPAGSAGSATPMLHRGFLVILLSVIGVVCFVRGSFHGYQRLQGPLTDAFKDVHQAALLGTELENLTMAANDSLSGVMSGCVQNMSASMKVASLSTSSNLTAVQVLAAAWEHVEVALKQTKEYNLNIKNTPAGLDRFKNYLDGAASRYSWKGLGLPVAPLLLVLLGCTLLYVNKTFMRCLEACCCGQCKRCMGTIHTLLLHKVGTILFVPIVLLTTLAVSTELTFAIGLSSFCEHVDSNMIAYIHHFAGPKTYSTSAYYITGEGSNPLLKHIDSVNELISNTTAQLGENKVMVEDTCHADLSWVMGQFNSMMNLTAAVETVLDEERIYPYYKEIVHVELCDSMVNGLSWLSLLGIFAGIISLPCMICAADDYFQKMSMDEEQEASGLSHTLVFPVRAEGIV